MTPEATGHGQQMAASSGRAAGSPDSPLPISPARRILCVDDNLDVLASYRALLEHAGYSVVSTDDSLTGLLLFSRGDFDAVILDYRMPFASGAVLATLMRRMRSDVRLILVSGSTEISQDEAAVFNCRLEKGLPSPILLQTLRDLIEARKPAPHAGDDPDTRPPLRFFAESGAERPFESRGA